MISPSRAEQYKSVKTVSSFESLKARGEWTFCNEFMQIVSLIFGIPGIAGKLARDMHLHFLANPKDWDKVCMKEAIDAVNAGFVVFAVFSDPEPRGDHICLLVPGEGEDSGSFACKVPLCANVGKKNFYGQKLSMAFTPEEMPELFVYHGEFL